MLFQAAVLAKLGNALRAPHSKEPFIVTAIYIHKGFSATRHLVYQPDIKQEHVIYTETKFDLGDVSSAFEFVFQLYNLVAQVKTQGQALANGIARLKKTADEIKWHFDPTLTVYKQKKSKMDDDDDDGDDGNEGEKESRKRKVPKKKDEEDISEDEIEDIMEQAGFSIKTDVMKGKWGVMRTMGIPKSVRRARTPKGSRVIVKFTQDAEEVAILKYLKKIGGRDHYIIDLLEVSKEFVGYLLVLPRRIPLPKALSDSYSPAIVPVIQKQFLEGIAFMHQHGVAHLDIKPENITVDQVSTLLRVSIIDFDTSVKVKGVETTMKGKVGTRGWIAPEVASGRKFSPILVWRWKSSVMG